MRSTLAIGGALLLIGVGLAGADYVFKEKNQSVPEPANGESTTSSEGSTTGSAPNIIKKGSSTQKNSGADIDQVFRSLQLIPEETSEVSLIGRAAGTSAEAVSHVLIHNNDRAFFFSMIEGSQVKRILAALKQDLQDQFSADLRELKDLTLTSTDGPPVDMLSFIDPKISPEPLLFLRVRDRLYELHIAERGQALLEPLVQALRR